MKKSGLADSPFFSATQKGGPVAPPPDRPQTERKPEKGKGNAKKPQAVKRTGHRGPAKPRHRDTTVSRYHDAIVEVVRKAVKQFGKEAATHRFTVAEKKAIADIIYAYRNQGIRTSENEIARIAVNFILHDYRENGENSVLDRVLRALNG